MRIRRTSILFVLLSIVVVSAALPLQRAAADSGGWYAEFFDNQTLSGSPIYTWNDPWIGHDWGAGAPAYGLSSERFSVRWTRSLEIWNEGTYHFCAMADDGVRIEVDNVLVLDEWHANGGTAYCGSQYVLAQGTHQIEVEYYDGGGNALIYVWWEEVEPSGPYAPVVIPAPVTTPIRSVSDDAPAPFDGWYGEYFGNRSLSGQPDHVRLDPWIGFNWGPWAPFYGMTRENFSIRWRRSVHFEQDDYSFCAMSDDGVHIWVDDTLVVDEWHDDIGNVHCGTHRVTEGVHQVYVEYYDNRDVAFIYVWWEEASSRNG